MTVTISPRSKNFAFANDSSIIISHSEINYFQTSINNVLIYLSSDSEMELEL